MMMLLTCNVWKMQCSGDMGILSSRGIASNSSWNKTEIIGTPCVLWNNRYHGWYHHGNQRLRKRTCWTPNEASRRPKFCGWILTLWAGNGYMPIALWESGYFFPNLFHGIKFVYDTTTTFAWWIKIQVFVVSSSQFRLGSGGHSYISKIFKSQSFSKPICSLDICSSIVSLPTWFCLSILLISHNLFWFTTNTSSLPCPSAPFVFFLLRIKNINKSYFYIYKKIWIHFISLKI